MSAGSDYFILSRAHLGASAALVYCLGGSHMNACAQCDGATLRYGESVTFVALLAGTPGRAFVDAHSLGAWSALMWHASRVTEPFPSGQVVESGGQRRSAFFPIILRMLAEGYRI